MPTFSRKRRRFGDLAQDQPRDVAVGLGQLDLLEPLERAPRGQRAEVLDARARDEHRARLRAQPRPAALRAGAQRHVLLDLLARELRVGLAVAALEVRDDPLEARRDTSACARSGCGTIMQPLAAGAVEEHLALILGELFPVRVEVHAVDLRDRLGHLRVVVGRAVRPRQRAFTDRERRVRHHELRVDLHHRAEPRAALAGHLRRVEREHARLELDQRLVWSGHAKPRRSEQRPGRGRLAGCYLRRGPPEPRTPVEGPSSPRARSPRRRRSPWPPPRRHAPWQGRRSRPRPCRRRGRRPLRSSPRGACAGRGASRDGRPRRR